jgi:hypothetical protein
LTARASVKVLQLSIVRRMGMGAGGMGTTPHLAWTFNSQPLWSVPPCEETFPCWTDHQSLAAVTLRRAFGRPTSTQHGQGHGGPLRRGPSPDQESKEVAAACSLSSSIRMREMSSLGVVPLDGASVTEPYCDQNDREDRRDEEVLHDSYSRTELAV